MFSGPDGPLLIDTTRPELLAACVAVVAHPDDERYQPLFGQTVVTPLFGASVPIVAHELADPEKGTGVAMICTFGDTTDVTWWRELSLPVRAIVQRDGRLRPITWGEPGWESTNPGAAQAAYDELAGKTVKQAQARIVELLTDAGLIEGEIRPITHPVKFWENGSRPLEIVTSQQWFIRYPPKDEMLARGKELAWWPDFMRVRYENWVNGLIGDWNITRQRFFGVPFPVWYPIDADGVTDFLSPILADEASLPIDPTTTVPAGYDESQRNQPGGFAADPDVMDTWATSSLTPQIVCGLGGRPRPVRAHLPDGPAAAGPRDHPHLAVLARSCAATTSTSCLPWANAAISGFVYDPDRKKLSKSAGNSPDEPMAAAGAARGRRRPLLGGQRPPGDGHRRRPRPDEDRAPARHQGAQRLEVRARLRTARSSAGEVTEPLDRAMLVELAELVDEATSAFDRFDYARALERTEAWFWSFCDDYLELVKNRAYGDGGGAGSAQAALGLALETLLKLFAPFLPYVTEEVWSWWRDGSIHRSAWPDSDAAARGRRRGRPRSRCASRPTCSRRCAGRSPRPSARCALPVLHVGRHRHRGAPRRARARGRRRPRTRVSSPTLATEVGDAYAVEVTLAPEG